MPTYEFRCPNGHEFERFYRKISDAGAEAPCPVCGAVAERQVSGGAGLLFKGSGFYLTDYGRNAHRSGGPGKGSASSDGAAGGQSSPSAKASESSGSEGKSSEAKSGGDSSVKSGPAAPTNKPGSDKS